MATIAQTLFSLLLVIALIFGTAWALRKLQRPLLQQQGPLKIKAQLMLGPRERLVLIEVEDQWILTGVTSQSIQTLAIWDRPDSPEIDLPPPSSIPSNAFQALFQQIKKK